MSDVVLSIVLPCLNEEQTIGLCIDEIREVMAPLDIPYEILIGDNGSEDRSREIATEKGARVIPVEKRGYGNAYLGSIPFAEGEWILMADADMSYDFREIPRFLEKRGGGEDMIVGSRIRGTIEPGAMPWMHRRIGTPVLTALLNLMFRTRISDSQSGMRLFKKKTWERLNLESPGMEYASEMLVKAARMGLTIGEFPMNFRKDRRDRPPHLQSFRDGWRHLRFLFLFSPFFLFLLPAFTLILLGVLGFLLSLYNLTLFGRTFSFHMSILGSVSMITGIQIFFFGLFARVHPLARKLRPVREEEWFQRSFRLEPWMLLFIFLLLVGSIGDTWLIYRWVSGGMGSIQPRTSVLVVTFATMFMVGLQGIFASLYLSILHIHRYGLK